MYYTAQDSQPTAKIEASERIAEVTQRFLDAGGEIKHYPSGVTSGFESNYVGTSYVGGKRDNQRSKKWKKGT